MSHYWVYFIPELFSKHDESLKFNQEEIRRLLKLEKDKKRAAEVRSGLIDFFKIQYLKAR